jgi:hypothetical protein
MSFVLATCSFRHHPHRITHTGVGTQAKSACKQAFTNPFTPLLCPTVTRLRSLPSHMPPVSARTHTVRYIHPCTSSFLHRLFTLATSQSSDVCRVGREGEGCVWGEAKQLESFRHATKASQRPRVCARVQRRCLVVGVDGADRSCAWPCVSTHSFSTASRHIDHVAAHPQCDCLHRNDSGFDAGVPPPSLPTVITSNSRPLTSLSPL